MPTDIDDAQHSTSCSGSTFSASLTAYSPNSIQNTPEVPFPEPESPNTAVPEPISTGSSQTPRKWDDNTVPGWPQLAVFMAKTPDFAAFSRFRDLNIKSLLYYQVQLTLLRKELQDKESVDAASDPEEEPASFAQRVDFLVEASGEEGKQFEIVERMRGVLKEYNKALLLYSQISALPEPDPYNMLNLRKWLRHEEGGYSHVQGDGKETWGDYSEDPDKDAPSLWTLWRQFWTVIQRFIWLQPPADDLDLVVTRPQGKIDGLTRWSVWYLIPFLESVREYREEKRRKRNEEGTPQDVEKCAKPNPNRRHLPKRRPVKAGKQARLNGAPRLNLGGRQVKKRKTIETWSEKTVLRITSGVSTVMACLLPVVAITVLSQLHGLRNLLLCLAGFSVIFAVGLIFLTQGTSTRVEIFTATAAFSAVMVVFISVPIVILPPGSPSPYPSSSASISASATPTF